MDTAPVMSETPRLPGQQTTETSAHKRRSNPVVITANTALSGTRLKNFYLTNAFQGFVWMIFHFSVVFFFTFQLKSVALVGVFLGVANLIAFFLDIPVGILQRYYSTKKLFMMAAIAQLIATGIFFSFIYNFFTAVGSISSSIIPDGFASVLGWFFGHSLNWILVIIASFCYGLAKEMNDISTYGYILSHASPSEYGKILACNNITYGFGSLAGLILSGIILSVNPTFAVLTLGVIIVGFLAFTSRFFDNADKSIEAQDIVSFTVAVKRMNKENVGEYLTEKIQAVDLPKIIENTKYIFLKPRKKEEQKISWTELAIETKKTAKTIYQIMTSLPLHLILYWTMSLVLIFGFWDTFASTFLIDYLDGKKPGWSYVILAIIALPALGLQEVAGNLASKIGVKTVAYIGLALSGGSLIAMGIFSSGGLGVVLACALINSLGYACGMSLGQNEFLYSYNHIYAEKMGLTEIDANASAGPMKILQNLANVIGLILGGFILGILGYAGFFIIFGLIILAVLAWSISRRGEIEV